MAITKVSRGLLNTGISDSSNATAITIDSSENVGIGTASPQTKLQVATANGTLSHFGGIATTNTHYTGISLGYSEAANANYRKTAIVQEQLADGAARGTLHFLVDTAADANSAALADSKMSIHGVSGDVSIANTLKFNSGFGSAGTAYGVRAWAQINQTTFNLNGSGGVSSATDLTGAGHTRVNFSPSLPDDNYVVLGAASNNNNFVGIEGNPPSSTQYSTSSVDLRIIDASNIGQELTNGLLNIAVIR